MSKNKLIKSLSKIIANVALHKLLAKHTNHPESKMFLNSEIIEYRNVAVNKSKEYNWNEYQKDDVLPQLKRRDLSGTRLLDARDCIQPLAEANNFLHQQSRHDLKEIQEEALKELRKFKEKYPDVEFIEKEDVETILNVLKELKIIS